MTTICEDCEQWVAASWPQYKNRLKNMKDFPDARTNPCPRCGGTYWAIKPPPGLPLGTGKLHSPLEPTDWTVATKVIGLSAAAILIAALFLLALTYRTHAQTTFRDSSGRLVGTTSRDSNGTVTMRNGSGQMTGTATRDSNGTTTFRDGSGRTTGTAERRR